MSKTINTSEGAARIDGVFADLSNARASASRWNLWIVMGDAGSYWTAKPRDAARLERAGYEIVN